jgi:hypothetical protein
MGNPRFASTEVTSYCLRAKVGVRLKRWALLTVALYLLCLSACAMPLILLLSDKDDEILVGFYAFFVPVLVLVQIVLLLVPVDIAKQRPVKKRKIIVSAILGSMLMGVMAFMFFFSISIMIWGENLHPYHGWVVFVSVAVIWVAWGIVFMRNFTSKGADGFLSSITRWLLRGSLMEILVAIPSHIISRHRGDCCAPVMTLIGLLSGISVALISFGPGLFFLFAKRLKEKKGKSVT